MTIIHRLAQMSYCIIHTPVNSLFNKRCQFPYFKNTGWAGAWVASDLDQNPTLFIGLPGEMRISGILLQGGGNACDCYITLVRIHGDRGDGNALRTVTIEGNTDRSHTARAKFNPPITVGIKYYGSRLNGKKK